MIGGENAFFNFPFGGTGKLADDSYLKQYEQYGSSVYNGLQYFTEAINGDFQRLVPLTEYSVYVHFPFCDSICRDCPYNRTVQTGLIEDYCSGVNREIDLIDLYWPQKQVEISTVYLGGGTPSLIPVSSLNTIMKNLQRVFIRGANPQVSIEVNPASLSVEKLDAYKGMGINRVSIGAQSFDDRALKEMSRSHTAQQSLAAIEMASKRKINFNVDLIYGFDCQTLDMFISDVRKVMDLGADHITIYSLIRKVEPELIETMEKKQSEMFNAAFEMLIQSGFQQQNAHSFGRFPDSVNQYEQDLWKEPLKDIVGLGSSSFGRTSKVYYLKHHPVKKYIKCLEREVPPLHFFGT